MIKILSIDGGGIRGLIPLRILYRIESDPEINKHNDEFFIYNNFNVFAGTSSGSMTIGGICYRKSSIKNLISDYLSKKTFREIMPINNNYIAVIILSIFLLFFCIMIGSYVLPLIICDKKYVSLVGGFIGFLFSVIIITIFSILILCGFPEYPNKHKTKLIGEYVGNDTKFYNTDKKVYITSYNLTKQSPEFFSSWTPNEYYAKDIIDASSAAPGFFSPVKIGNDHYIDGGLLNNNPTDCVYAEVLKEHKGHRVKILSIGCGKNKINDDVGGKSTIWWILSGQLRLFIGGEQSVDKRVRDFSTALGDSYMRINGVVENMKIDELSDSHINYLNKIGDEWFEENRQNLINFFKEI